MACFEIYNVCIGNSWYFTVLVAVRDPVFARGQSKFFKYCGSREMKGPLCNRDRGTNRYRFPVHARNSVNTKGAPERAILHNGYLSIICCLNLRIDISGRCTSSHTHAKATQKNDFPWELYGRGSSQIRHLPCPVSSVSGPAPASPACFVAYPL